MWVYHSTVFQRTQILSKSGSELYQETSIVSYHPSIQRFAPCISMSLHTSQREMIPIHGGLETKVTVAKLLWFLMPSQQYFPTFHPIFPSLFLLQDQMPQALLHGMKRIFRDLMLKHKSFSNKRKLKLLTSLNSAFLKFICHQELMSFIGLMPSSFYLLRTMVVDCKFFLTLQWTKTCKFWHIASKELFHPKR